MRLMPICEKTYLSKWIEVIGGGTTGRMSHVGECMWLRLDKWISSRAYIPLLLSKGSPM
jgi:hypothetical protein